jgi:hypothetical protein
VVVIVSERVGRSAGTLHRACLDVLAAGVGNVGVAVQVIVQSVSAGVRREDLVEAGSLGSTVRIVAV